MPPWSAIAATGMPRPLSDDGARAVRVQGDLHAVAVARQRLVDAVVHDLVDEVVEAARPGGADVHARSAADRLQALEDGDVPGVVLAWWPTERRAAMDLRSSSETCPVSLAAPLRRNAPHFSRYLQVFSPDQRRSPARRRRRGGPGDQIAQPPGRRRPRPRRAPEGALRGPRRRAAAAGRRGAGGAGRPATWSATAKRRADDARLGAALGEQARQLVAPHRQLVGPRRRWSTPPSARRRGCGAPARCGRRRPAPTTSAHASGRGGRSRRPPAARPARRRKRAEHVGGRRIGSRRRLRRRGWPAQPAGVPPSTRTRASGGLASASAAAGVGGRDDRLAPVAHRLQQQPAAVAGRAR